MMSTSLWGAASVLLVLAGSIPAMAEPLGSAPLVSPSLFDGMRWRDVGPFRGGRSDATVGVPAKPGVFYMGAAAGGVWQTADFGATWKPIFDSVGVPSIGAIAVAPSNPNVLYVGTGESALRGDITYGQGVFRSADGGRTWTHAGLEDTRQIGAIAIDPRNPNIVLVAAIGHAFGPNTQRGVFRSADGGKTWAKVLYRNEDTGAIDVIIDPLNPKIVYATLWQVRRQPWHFSSGGPGSGLFKSVDGGIHWTELKGRGLPQGTLGRIDVSISAVNDKRVYAMIEATTGGLYRSDDGGETWKLINQDGRIRQRAWYFSKVFADPQKKDTVYVVNTGLLRSTDGGATFNLVPARHGDHHFLWINPTNDAQMIDASDGGATISLDGGKTWSPQNNQPTAAIYHVSVDNRFPYWLYGAQQDNTNLAIATFDDDGAIGPRDWYPAGGGECGFVLPDPRDPDIIVSDSENMVSRFDRHSMQAQDISAWPVDNSGHPAAELLHRFNWTSPMLRSAHDPDTLYVASEVVWRTTNQGHSWQIISPDLTRNDKSKQTASGGPITKDITSVEYYDTIFSLAESPLKQGLLWAGSDDGLVHLSEDAGTHWADVTPSSMPAWSTVSIIEPSHFDVGVAYIAVDRHKLDDLHPYAYKTTDSGKTWQAIVDGLPDGAIVHAVREDPLKRGLLYAGTERGVFVSFDDGNHWQPLQLNLPVSPVHDLVVKDDDLIAATHGRGFWVLDNVTPLRQIGPGVKVPDIALYVPEPALRLHYPDDVDARGAVGQNPPRGAMIDYFFRVKPSSNVTVTISDSAGRVVRHLSSLHSTKQVQPPEWPDRLIDPGTIPAAAGMNRLIWDLRMDDPVQIPGAFYSDQAPRGPLVAPGSYTVRLSAEGQTFSVPLTVVTDPRTRGQAQAITDVTELEKKVTADISDLHQTVDDLRAARVSLARTGNIGCKSGAAPADSAVIGQLSQLERTLMQVDMKGSEANLAFPGMLNEQLASFQLSLDGADAEPTQPQEEMYASLHQRWMAALAQWRDLQKGGLAHLDAGSRCTAVGH